MRKIVIFIKDVLVDKEYYIQTDIQSNFYELIHAIRNSKNIDSKEPIVVYEKFTQKICDCDVSFENLGIESGMHFVIF